MAGAARRQASIGIERAHLEEDTGKSTHVGGGGRIHDAEHSLIDYNRAGVPLLEIVGAPDIRSAEEAQGVRVGAARRSWWPSVPPTARWRRGRSGSTATCRCVPRGSDELGTRCEIKNVNSLRSLGRAIEYEAARQVDLIDARVRRCAQQTRHWNEDDGRTHKLRSKEEADDYRYFPEPDLVRARPGPGVDRTGARPRCRCCPPPGVTGSPSAPVRRWSRPR